MKIKNMLARVIVNLVNGSEYSFTALSGENITGVEHLQEFGFASEKPDGEDANGIAVFYGGDRGNSSLLVLEVPKFKPNLDDGEAAIFNAFSALLKLTKDGVIELNGSGNGGAMIVSDFINAFNAHTHPTAALGAPSTPTLPLIATAYENTKVVH